MTQSRHSSFDQIFLGAVGMPRLVPDHISLWGVLIKIRREMRLSLNIRPAKMMRGLQSPLREPKDFNFVIVRGNSEGEYSEIGGRIHRDEEDETAIQNAVFTKKATSRAINFALELAAGRSGMHFGAAHLCSIRGVRGIFAPFHSACAIPGRR
jgi:tartrate dehydrogenase/decarboxylase/D-malate dehydrogenase